MRIICTQQFLSLAECFTYCGHQVAVWTPNISIFDLFYKVQPELFIIDYKEIDEVVERCLQKYPATRLVVKGNNFNRCDLVIDDNINTTLFFLPKACNILRYTNPKYNSIFKCDIGYIGKNNKYIQGVCQLNLNIKSFGENIYNQYYCGFIAQNLIGDFFKTAKVVLHVHEEECSQQIFDAMYCEAQIVSDISSTSAQFFYDRVDWINEFSINTLLDIRQPLNINQLLDNKQYIFNEHTYFDRCISLFKELDLPYQEFIDKKNEFKHKYFRLS